MQICGVCGKVIRESDVLGLDMGAYQHKAPCGAILYRILPGHGTNPYRILARCTGQQWFVSVENRPN